MAFRCVTSCQMADWPNTGWPRVRDLARTARCGGPDERALVGINECAHGDFPASAALFGVVHLRGFNSVQVPVAEIEHSLVPDLHVRGPQHPMVLLGQV